MSLCRVLSHVENAFVVGPRNRQVRRLCGPLPIPSTARSPAQLVLVGECCEARFLALTVGLERIAL